MAENISIQPKYLVPEISTKVIKATYNYLSKYHLKSVFYKICDQLEVPPDFFLNDDNWHSNELNKQFCNKLIDLTNDEDILYKIGAEFLSPENINYFEYTLIKSSPPFIYFSMTPSEIKKVNKLLDLEIVKSRPGHFVYKFTPKRGKHPHPGVIENVLGCFQSFKNTFGLNSLTAERETCITRGDKSTTIVVKYSALSFWLYRLMVISSTLLFSYIVANLFVYYGQSMGWPVAFLSTFSLITLFVATFFITRFLINLLKGNSQYYKNTAEKNHDIYEKNRQLKTNYEEANHIKELCFKLLQVTDPHKVINDCLESLSTQKRYKTSIVMILNEKRGKLYTAGFKGVDFNQSSLRKLEIVYPAQSNEDSLFANILSAGKTVLIDDMEEYKKKLKLDNELLIDQFKVRSLIICPLQDKSQKYGLLITGSLEGSEVLEKKDTFHIENVANLLSLFFQNTSRLTTERAIRSTYEKYVPSAVHRKIEEIQNIDNWRIAPQNVDLTSFFIDLRGFTPITENSQPEEIFEFLNIYAEFISSKIGQYGGIVDNIVADQVVAFFLENRGDKTRHARDALLCGLDILRSWEELKTRLAKNGFPKIEAGIGIHTGSASTGTLGSSHRCNYTSLGDTINIASRLQDLTKGKAPNETILIASDYTLRRANFTVGHEKIASAQIRGRVEPLDLGLIRIPDAIQAIENNPIALEKLKVA
jgi:class 3 adenylate cyclase